MRRIDRFCRPTQVVVRRVEVQAEADEHAGHRVAVVFVGLACRRAIVDRGGGRYQCQQLLRQHFLQLFRRNAEAVERHRDVVEEEPRRRVLFARPAGCLRCRQGVFVPAEDAFLERAERLPRPDVCGHADDGDAIVRLLAKLGNRHALRGDGQVGPFFEQQVGVDAAEAEAADGSAAGAIGSPRFGRCQHAERRAIVPQVRTGRGEVRLWWQRACRHRPQHFHRRGGTGTGQQVADSRLHRTDDALPRLRVVAAPEFG